MKYKNFFYAILGIFFIFKINYSLDFNFYFNSKIEANKKDFNLKISLKEHEFILADNISLNIDSPELKITDLKFVGNLEKIYLPEYKADKNVYKNELNISGLIYLVDGIQSNKEQKTINASLFYNFVLEPTTVFIEKKFNFIYGIEKSDLNFIKTAKNNNKVEKVKQKGLEQEVKFKIFDLERFFEKIVATTDSNYIKILLALILGFLLSFTPCIYAMLPITVGILNKLGRASIFYSFITSILYAFGISSTFSILGLLSAFAGATFGGFLSNPFFIIFIILFIIFISFSMIGFFDINIPTLISSDSKIFLKFGPLFSAFIFGLISGTIASPCVSPGLALLLTIVATIGNKLIGFFILFSFGLGMTIPLIIIGTFSGALNRLPKAGSWMVEIKKIIGFLMLSVTFYYLKNIVSINILLWCCMSYFLFLGVFYIFDSQKTESESLQTIKSFIGISAIIIAFFIGVKSFYYKPVKKSYEIQFKSILFDNYLFALKDSKEKNKILLLDFTANYCSICSEINKKFFENSLFLKSISKFTNICKIDSDKDIDIIKNLKNKFKVIAQPTILLLNPKNEKVLMRWSSEPYKFSYLEFKNKIYDKFLLI